MPGSGSKPSTGLVWGWPLPRDLRNALGDDRSPRLDVLLGQVANPGLLLQRYPAYPQRSGSGGYASWGWKLGRKDYKNDLWKELERTLGSIYRADTYGRYFQALKRRHRELMATLRAQGYQIRSCTGKVVWRLIVGLGLPSPLETGITLHHLYGFPYLPGSAVKGVTRSWRLQQTADALGIPRLNGEEYKRWKEEKNYGLTPWERLEQLLMSPVPRESEREETRDRLRTAIASRLRELCEAVRKARAENFDPHDGDPALFSFDPENQESVDQLVEEHIEKFSRVFGSTAAHGEVIFFDGYPESLTVDGKPILELDVMTPHYSDYYTKDSPPADWLSPNPVLFLTVRRGTAFRISLACRDTALLNEVMPWTERALGEFGIGAKTNAGYGELRCAEVEQE